MVNDYNALHKKLESQNFQRSSNKPERWCHDFWATWYNIFQNIFLLNIDSYFKVPTVSTHFVIHPTRTARSRDTCCHGSKESSHCTIWEFNSNLPTQIHSYTLTIRFYKFKAPLRLFRVYRSIFDLVFQNLALSLLIMPTNQDLIFDAVVKIVVQDILGKLCLMSGTTILILYILTHLLCWQASQLPLYFYFLAIANISNQVLRKCQSSKGARQSI